MTRQEHLLVKVMEECAEVQQRVAKILRFGMDEVQPGQRQDNRERLCVELDDLFGVLEMVGVSTRDLARVCAHQEKVERYLDYSRQLGTLAP